MLQMYIYMINSLIMLILVIIMIMISVAFSTLFERKIMSLYHYRKGPNKISFIGLTQPMNDALKLIFKENLMILKVNYFIYLITPIFMLILTFLLWLLYPFYSNMMSFKLNILFFLCIMSMSVYSLMLSGWSSNTNFSMIGTIRSMAQSISYEVIFSIIILISILYTNSFNFKYLMYLNKFISMIYFLPIMFMYMYISMLAEINRTPFDLSESESELISGFNIEYSSKNFMFIFLAEYASILFMMMLITMMFLFNKLIQINFYLNLILLFFVTTWIRMTFPRMRYDKLMYLCWFYILPFTLLNFLMYLFIYKYTIELIIYN
uniref:NADH-ubiquinone oxidoreductase chain 1 n=1 Tax=Macrocentrus camphoraphilus TaxID=684659 RepID=D8WHD7_9HYME|nr:NADH dehydrogenase subunit 1 [Macrocentrus camphoraphilus]